MGGRRIALIWIKILTKQYAFITKLPNTRIYLGLAIIFVYRQRKTELALRERRQNVGSDCYVIRSCMRFICASLFNPLYWLIGCCSCIFCLANAPLPWLSPEQSIAQPIYRLCQIRTRPNKRNIWVPFTLCQQSNNQTLCVVSQRFLNIDRSCRQWLAFCLAICCIFWIRHVYGYIPHLPSKRHFALDKQK